MACHKPTTRHYESDCPAVLKAPIQQYLKQRAYNAGRLFMLQVQGYRWAERVFQINQLDMTTGLCYYNAQLGISPSTYFRLDSCLILVYDNQFNPTPNHPDYTILDDSGILNDKAMYQDWDKEKKQLIEQDSFYARSYHRTLDALGAQILIAKDSASLLDNSNNEAWESHHFPLKIPNALIKPSPPVKPRVQFVPPK